jgi:Protein of unknown function (DUF3223)
LANGKSVQLSTRLFATKRDATAHFKAMLARYRVGDRVEDDDGKDLAALLMRHPEYDNKIGPGISHFEVMSADYGTRCFRVVRVDGTGISFSYPYCIVQ